MSDNLACARARESGRKWLDDKLGNPTPEILGQMAWDADGLIDIFAAGAEWATAPETEAEVDAALVDLLRSASSTEDAAAKVKGYLGAIHRQEQDHWASERARLESAVTVDELPLPELARAARYWSHYWQARLIPARKNALVHDPAAKIIARDALKEVEIDAAKATALADLMDSLVQKSPADGTNIVAIRREGTEGTADKPASNLRPITEGPLADPGTVEGLMGAAGMIDADAGADEPAWRREGVADLVAFRVNTADPRFDPTRPVTINGFLYQPTKEND